MYTQSENKLKHKHIYTYKDTRTQIKKTLGKIDVEKHTYTHTNTLEIRVM